MRQRSVLALLLAAGFVSLSACASAPSRRAGDAVRLNVPFYPDDTDQCGPSSLASVLTYWKQDATPPVLKKEIYLAKLKGSLPFDLLIAAQKRLPARMVNEGLDSLKAELRAGRPIVAYLNRGWEFAPVGHYVAVVGFDEGRKGVYAHSALKEASFIPYRKFLNDWKKTDYWAIYVSSTPAH
jgi:hypothetical protein